MLSIIGLYIAPHENTMGPSSSFIDNPILRPASWSVIHSGLVCFII